MSNNFICFIGIIFGGVLSFLSSLCPDGYIIFGMWCFIVSLTVSIVSIIGIINNFSKN